MDFNISGCGLERAIVPYVCFQNWLWDAFSNDVCLPYVPRDTGEECKVQEGPISGELNAPSCPGISSAAVLACPNMLKRGIPF